MSACEIILLLTISGRNLTSFPVVMYVWDDTYHPRATQICESRMLLFQKLRLPKFQFEPHGSGDPNPVLWSGDTAQFNLPGVLFLEKHVLTLLFTELN